MVLLKHFGFEPSIVDTCSRLGGIAYLQSDPPSLFELRAGKKDSTGHYYDSNYGSEAQIFG